MNWIRENKSLAAVLGFVVCAAGALLVLLFSAWSGFSEVTESSAQQTAELKRLQGSEVYPDNKNLTVYKDQQKEFADHVDALQKRLGAMELPLEPLKPEEFQDRLRAAVSGVLAKAERNKVTIADPGKFYLGFAQYQTTPPNPDAASALGRQLASIELVVNLLLESRIQELAAVTVDSQSTKTPAPKAEAAPGRDAKQTALVSWDSFKVTFTSDPQVLRRVINGISKTDKQFYVLRKIQVKNTNDKGPSRLTDATQQQVPAEDPQAGATAPAKPALKFIVGTEQVQAELLLDVAHFSKEPLKP